jgi:hypothetical protein
LAQQWRWVCDEFDASQLTDFFGLRDLSQAFVFFPKV